jgi:hypothetical protein
MALNPKAIVSRIQPKTMNSNQAGVIQQLESLGYEARLESGYVHILARDGRELIRIPLVAFLDDDYRSALPIDLLDRRD